jgi:hypothetical protein
MLSATALGGLDEEARLFLWARPHLDRLNNRNWYREIQNFIIRTSNVPHMECSCAA